MNADASGFPSPPTSVYITRCHNQYLRLRYGCSISPKVCSPGRWSYYYPSETSVGSPLFFNSVPHRVCAGDALLLDPRGCHQSSSFRNAPLDPTGAYQDRNGYNGSSRSSSDPVWNLSWRLHRRKMIARLPRSSTSSQERVNQECHGYSASVINWRRYYQCSRVRLVDR